MEIEMEATFWIFVWGKKTENGNWYKPKFEASARRLCFGLRTTAMRIYSEVIEEVYLPHMGQSCSPMWIIYSLKQVEPVNGLAYHFS